MTFDAFRRQFQICLNPQQEAAVRATEGPILLLAVPGSGKTTVLVTRLGYLLFCKNVPPQRILTVTYTVAAAGDMKRRFASLFGEEQAGHLAFRTINGLCDTMIRHYAKARGSNPFALVTNDGELSSLVRELMKGMGCDFPSDQEVKEVRTQITYCKNMMLTDAEIESVKLDNVNFSGVYFAYREYLRKHSRMDYDDQLVFAYQILRRYRDILEHFQNRYPYLCVDEAQDTSKIQHAILRLLAAPRNNIFMVGDEDQSIYGFRAAWPQALLEFEAAYPGAHVLLMETNYRSTGSIVSRADAFIQRNQSRRPKHMRTDNPQGEPIRRIDLADYNRQYNYLLKVAQSCDRPTAVLYRNNDSALPLIDLLNREGVPFAIRQREAFFFTSPIVRDLTDILRFGFDDTNRESFLRFYYKLDLKLKKTVVANLLRYQQEGQSVFEVLLQHGDFEPWQMGKIKSLQTHFSKFPDLSSYAALKRILKFMGYGDYLKEQRADTTRVDILLALANQTRVTGEFILRLEDLRRTVEEGVSNPNSLFLLSTIHASKGLEYDRVLLIDVLDGSFPTVMEPSGGGELSPEETAALEEERRLFYVGATRAQNQLELLTYEKKFGEETGAYSSFVHQLIGDEPTAIPRQKAKTTRPAPHAGPTAEQIASWEKDYIPGTEVRHKKFGRGIVQNKVGSVVTIGFFDGGIKKLDLAACLKSELIELRYFVPGGN